ncbi:unnamed protein product [Linum trigynum]|uniref:Secreted protein n=1 Tax=Linum trigynum TaxID=586398 RepID=A0AAV2F687_9ROSI
MPISCGALLTHQAFVMASILTTRTISSSSSLEPHRSSFRVRPSRSLFWAAALARAIAALRHMVLPEASAHGTRTFGGPRPLCDPLLQARFDFCA